ncbi:MAG: sensor histidine kinase [Jatrophihabitans sp.]|uniref:sensor histidine kinase n=1 Tax=Jatrophihabitans sp. TaxID=1932789 RepID=UPI00390DC44A
MTVNSDSGDAAFWQADGAMSDRRPVSRLLSELLRRRTWREALYGLVGLPIGIAGFVFTIVALALSGGLLITFIGLPLLAATGLASRQIAAGLRRLANRLVGADIPAPQPFRPERGLLGWIGSCLRDGTAWRSRLYLVLKFPLGIAGFVVTVVFWTYGVGGITYATWRPALGCNRTSDGKCHHAIGFTDTWQADTPFRIVLMSLAGLVLLLAAPWAVRGIVYLDVLAMRLLLGPTARADRVAELERTRAVAVDDSAATLRRIERDLHDGAQARLVALAMNVGLAREKLAEGGDVGEAGRLLDRAHVTAKEAIVELRDLARGIHPPVLDAGLDAALATLTAHSAVPVRLSTAITERPLPAIETMAYFCAAELLTNVAKHSGARGAWVDARTVSGRLRLEVGDDGRGGARIGAGSGLSGLAERIATVDGRLIVSSPDGGPTTVTVDLPLRAGSTA